MSQIGRNDLCHCGSGEKYKRCCLDRDQAAGSFQAALPELREAVAQNVRESERLRDEYGVYVNYVRPVDWQGGKVWAIGSRVYPGRPPNETFHEFLLHVLRGTLGEKWRATQAALPEHERHFVMKCFDEYAKWTRAGRTPENQQGDGIWAAVPSGWVQCLLSLAWDVANLIHASNLPDGLVDRLRDPVAYQGARYEVAIAAVFARLDCEIRFLDEEERLRGVKHVEFVATHRPTGQEIAVEAKSRHRPGVLNQGGDRDDDPFRGDSRAVRRLFTKALEKAPADLPFMVFIDINAPLEPEAEIFDKRWQRDIRGWMDRLPTPAADNPDLYNALYVTNFSPHYDGDDLAQGDEWLAVLPLYARTPAIFDLTGMLGRALDTYHRVPEITESSAPP